jgi:hypothetical protein
MYFGIRAPKRHCVQEEREPDQKTAQAKFATRQNGT